MSVFLQPIYTQTMSNSTSDVVTFNNIPQGFTDLVLEISARTTIAQVSAGIYINLNNNFDNAYTSFGYSANSTNVGAFSERNNIAMYIGQINGASSTANVFTSKRIHLTNYTDGDFKIAGIESTMEADAAVAYLENGAGTWRNTAPVTQLRIATFGAGNFVQNSTFTLYGLSNVYDTNTPTAPTIGTATDQGGFASVTFTPAANDRADTYALTTSPTTTTVYGDASPITSSALTLGQAYTFQVSSVNALGSTASSASNSVTSDNNYTCLGVVTGAVGNFYAIPQTYKHLQIRYVSRDTSANASYVYLQFQQAAGSNYAYHTMTSNGSSISISNQVNQGLMVSTNPTPNSGVTANVYGAGIVDIYDYTNRNTNTIIRSSGGYDANGSGNSGIGTALFNNAFQITSIVVSTAAGAPAAQSQWALYGIG